MEFLEIDYSQTGELGSSLEFFLTSHRGKLAGKGGQLGSTSVRRYTCGLWDRAFSMEMAKRVNIVMVESVMQPPKNQL